MRPITRKIKNTANRKATTNCAAAPAQQGLRAPQQADQRIETKQAGDTHTGHVLKPHATDGDHRQLE